MRIMFLFLAVLLVAGCQSSKILKQEATLMADYSIIYVIHGDANYLYHDAKGQALQADEQVLAEAREVARQAASGEVFIFHQKPENKILWLFPKKDRRFLYYRNGVKIADRRYSPPSEQKSFVRESKLYHNFSALDSSVPSPHIFLYFGHEIPETSTGVYHFSRPEALFNTDVFARGQQRFLSSKISSFDLTVLSTCNNGTPTMIDALSSFSNYVLASPQNLHLSHIDTDPLPDLLEQDPLSVEEIANILGANTYQRLSNFLQTAITLSVYDISKTSTYRSAMAKRYLKYIKNLSKDGLMEVNHDCATLPFFDISTISDGVKTWYSPPQFGSKKTEKTNYSGWGCK